MELELWKHLKTITDKKNPFVKIYDFNDGDYLYVEPLVFTQLQSLKLHHPDRFQEIITDIEAKVKKYHHFILVPDDEFESLEIPNGVYQTVYDITDQLLIFVEDKSRGSDYGD